MDIRINREAFLSAANAASRVADGRSLPILGHMLLQVDDGMLSMTGSNLELEVTAHCQADQVDDPGTCTIPAKKATDIARALPPGAELRLRIDRDRCLLTSGRGRYQLAILPAEDFPRTETITDATMIQMTAGDLSDLIGKTRHAMAVSDVRYYLNGLLMTAGPDGLRVVATDGHRLAAAAVPLAQSTVSATAIIPANTVREIDRALGERADPIALALNNRMLRLSIGTVTLTSKLIDAKYPQWERVVPSDLEQSVTLDRNHLLQSINRLSVLANDIYHDVRATFDPGVLRLTANNQENEQSVEEIDIDYPGPPLTIGYNLRYLSDALRAINSERIALHFTGPDASARLHVPDAPDDVHVVMPMRL